MIKRSLKDIEEMTQGFGLKKKHKDIYIEGVSTDSRKIEKGQLFIPILGENFNGHEFIMQVIEKGASATLWNKNEPIPENVDFPFILVEDTLLALQNLAKEYRNQLNLKVVGITGSNGKTSTKDILASILATKYKTKKTMGNLNNHIGTPLTILNLDEDTEMAVIEMGTSNFGEISLLTSIAKPDIAIITNIGEAHLQDLKTRENIGRAKLEILEGLNPEGLFVYCGDDPLLKKEVENIDIKQKILAYGVEDLNDYQCQLGIVDQNSLSFSLKKPTCHDFFVPMLGKHHMYNATAAIAVADYLDISFESIQEGLYHIDKTGMRNELVYAEGFTILNDSYKSNPSSVLAALDTLYGLDGYKQKIVILGDMQGLGEDELKMHEEIGLKIDPRQVEYIFTIGPLSQHIAKAARINFKKDNIISCNNKVQLVEKVKRVIKPNALILVKASRALELEKVVDALRKEVTFPKDEVI